MRFRPPVKCPAHSRLLPAPLRAFSFAPLPFLDQSKVGKKLGTKSGGISPYFGDPRDDIHTYTPSRMCTGRCPAYAYTWVYAFTDVYMCLKAAFSGSENIVEYAKLWNASIEKRLFCLFIASRQGVRHRPFHLRKETAYRRRHKHWPERLARRKDGVFQDLSLLDKTDKEVSRHP